MYQKTYAVIVERDYYDGVLTVRTDAGEDVLVGVGRRNGGRTKLSSLVPGLRIKLYQRPRDKEPHFRRVGR